MVIKFGEKAVWNKNFRQEHAPVTKFDIHI